MERRGKHQLLHLDDGRILHVHFRMNGDWAHGKSDAELPRFARAVIEFDGGTRLVFVDSRALGSERFMREPDFFDAPIGHHGLERKNMIGGCTVNRATRAGRVVRNHSSKCRS